MRKFYLVVLLGLLMGPMMGWGQGTETFAGLCTTTCTPINTSYGTRSWTGVNGISWSATDSRSDQTITTNAITIRNGALTFGLAASQQAAGIGSLTLSAKAPFGSPDVGALQLVVNGTTISSKTTTGTTTSTVVLYTWSNINVSSLTSIVINQTTSGSRITIDDISWTAAPISGTSTITAGAGTEPATISSLTNTLGAASLNFDFDYNDDGATPATDALATQISQMIITPGTGNAIANWTQAIAGAELSDGTKTATATVNAANLTFASLLNTSGEIGYIADNATKTYSLKVWLKSALGGTLPATIDGLVLAFNIQNSGVTNVASTSTLASSQSVESGAAKNIVTVVATKTIFTTEPLPNPVIVNTNFTTAGVVAAVDANGNRDLNVSSAVTVSNDQGFTTTGTFPAFIAGVLTFPAGFQFTSRTSTPTIITIDDGNVATTNANSAAITVHPTPTISTSAITGSTFCVTASVGAAVSVDFTSAGVYTGNTYTAQLSDALGAFTTPTTIGTLVSNANSGTISATIPANRATGTGYRIRVISNSPVAATATDNGTNLTINLAAISLSSTTTQNINVGANGTALTVTEQSTAVSRLWSYSTVSGGPYSTSTANTTTTYTPNFATQGTYFVVCQSFFACGTVTSTQVIINVAATITTGAVTGSPFCVTSSVGATVSVPFTSAGTFTANTYTAQLSNAAGTFGAPVAIGTLVSNLNNGTITATIPANTATGTGYRIRVISNGPTVNGTDNGSALLINLAVTSVAPTGTQNIVASVNGTSIVASESSTSSSRLWSYSSVSGGPYTSTGNTTTTYPPNFTTPGTYYVIYQSTFACLNYTSAEIRINVRNPSPNTPAIGATCSGLGTVFSVGNTQGNINWTAPSTGTAPDGYALFAIAGATAPAGTLQDANTYAANSDFSAAVTANPSTLGKCLYIGSGLSAAVSGFTSGSTYSFRVYAYKGNTFTGWSTGAAGNTKTSVTFTVPNVTALSPSVASGQSVVSWTLPSNTSPNCWDEIMVVANAGAVSFTPSGNGSAYTANSTYSTANQVVYKGTGSSFTTTGLTNGTQYCFNVFTRRGTEWSTGVSSCVFPFTNIAVTDNGCTSSNYATTTFNYPANLVITKVTVGVKITTTYRGDLILRLVSPAGTEIVLQNSVGTSADNLDALFDDAGLGSAASGNHTIDGTYDITCPSQGAPTQPLSTFIGELSQGIWTLKVCDDAGSDLAYINDFTVFVTGTVPCVSTVSISSFAPASGPVGSVVTISGSGFTGATAVKFGTVNATSFIVVNSTTITAKVPTNAVTEYISVLDASSCAKKSITGFTVVSSSGACGSSGTVGTELFISEVFDGTSGDDQYVEIFNPTAGTILLSGYSIRIIAYGNTGSNTTNIAFTAGASIASGAVYLLRIGNIVTSTCGLSGNQSSGTGGFNGNDEVFLLKAGSILDYVPNPPSLSGAGFSQLRNATVTAPSSNYISSEWTVSGTENCSNLGIGPYSLGSPLTITNPSDVSSCALSMTVTAAPVSGPTFQWKYQNGAAGIGWTDLVDGTLALPGASVAGATTATLTMTGDLTLYNQYQFYCLVTNGTCTKPSNAAQFIISADRFFKSVTPVTGNWNAASSWLMATSAAGPWISTCTYPTAANSDYISIESGSDITLNLSAITLDQLTIKSGGKLTMPVTVDLTINDGSTGADFIIEGTLTDNTSSAHNTTFNTGATWSMVSNSNYIKTNNSSILVFQNNFDGGIATSLPSDANWIHRYTGASTDISLATVGAYYPNLTFESTAGVWTPGVFSKFTGAAGTAIIKGNLDVGGTGAGTVSALINDNTNTTPLQILGSLTVRTGNTFTTAGAANGTGYEVKGNVTVDGTLTAISNNVGILKLSGAAVQNVSGGGTINLQDFTAANTASTITLNKDITIPGVLTSSSGTLQLTTGNITMKSTAAATARVAPVVGAITYGTGQFIIERNVAALRSWRLLTAPVVSTQTIRQAWMENAVPSTTSPLFNDIPVPNYGTHISGPLPSINGFDVTPQNNYSLKKYDGLSGKWVGTGITPGGTTITSEQGWMLFVRGDRSYPISTTTSGTTPQPTTLRTTGQIKTGTQPIINPVGYTVVGNPYASAVNFRNLTKTLAGAETYYIWDPKITSGTTSTVVGGFITCTWNGAKYIQAPVAISAIDDLTGRIESGAAIVVSSANITSLNFKEADKATGSNLVFRPTPLVTSGKSLRANLYVKNTDASLALFDGTMNLFDKSFSNRVDGSDALKLTNFVENLSIKSDDTLVAIERRKMPTEKDTIFYNLKQLKVRNYTLEFVAENMYDYKLEGFIEDKYLQRNTKLNMSGTTRYSFSVEDVPGAYAANRFHIAFRKVNTLFGLSALGENDHVNLNWNVTEEYEVCKYEVERSTNGINFQSIATALSKGNNDGTNSYGLVDKGLIPAIYHYRLKIITNNGAFAYSDVVKVTLMNTKSPMYVFPNPVTNGNIGLQFNSQPVGKYAVRLMNELGQVMLNKQLVHGGGTASYIIPYTAAAGNYQLEVTSPGKKQTVLKVQLVQ